jgi:threonine aldolase
VQPLDDLRRLRALVAGTGVRLHLDGARLWNAHVATGVPLEAYGTLFDTVAVCLSKGLGAPVGSVLAGSRDAMAEARQWRKRMGAGWRQAGVLAAAGIYALDHHVERIADDHANARMIAGIIAAEAPDVVDPAAVETNIVLLDVGARAPELVELARAEGVLISVVAPGIVRLITHLDVSSDQAKSAGETLARLVPHR